MIDQLGVKALTVEDLLQAQKEISAHNRQLKEQTKQLERDMSLLRDHSLLLVRLQCYIMFLYHPIIIIECGCDHSWSHPHSITIAACLCQKGAITLISY